VRTLPALGEAFIAGAEQIERDVCGVIHGCDCRRTKAAVLCQRVGVAFLTRTRLAVITRGRLEGRF
jgi:hypothetical protein